MKKHTLRALSLALALLMTLGLASCSSSSGGNDSGNSSDNSASTVTENVDNQVEASGLTWNDVYMGFCASNTGNDIMKVISEAVQADIIDRGGRCEIASADGDAAKQIEQVENFVTMGCNVILVMAVENDALSDAIQKAKDAGVLTLTLSTDCSTQDCYMSSGDEKAMGMYALNMALDWVKETFDTSETIYGGIIACEDSAEAAYRCEAYDEAVDLFAEAGYTLEILDKQTVTWTYEAGQEAAENMILQYPQINLWLCYNGVIAQGASEAVMTASTIPDVSKVGAFCVDCSTDIAELLIASSNNESVLRGAVSTGALSDFAGMAGEVIGLWIDGEDVPADYSLTPFVVNAENAEDFIAEYGG
jgi:ribose transport system substrate-binding protein